MSLGLCLYHSLYVAEPALTTVLCHCYTAPLVLLHRALCCPRC